MVKLSRLEKMNKLIFVCRKFKRTPPQIFRCAHAYFETGLSEDTMEKHYYTCCRITIKGILHVKIVPDIVLNFCEALLEKKTTIPTKRELMKM